MSANGEKRGASERKRSANKGKRGVNRGVRRGSDKNFVKRLKRRKRSGMIATIIGREGCPVLDVFGIVCRSVFVGGEVVD